LVCYWFEKARALIEQGKTKRTGLIATQGIRGGANRKVLERIKSVGDIFYAWSDRNWILDGATVHVSIVGFDAGYESSRQLNGAWVDHINPDLSSSLNLVDAQSLSENKNLAFMGITPAGKFDVAGNLARQWISSSGNPNGMSNANVLRPYYNGIDLTRGNRDIWIIDFGVDMPMDKAAEYEKPFEYLKQFVLPARRSNKREAYKSKWWIHAEARPAMRTALSSLERFIGTSLVSKHLIFCWIPIHVLPANLLIVFARSDDYFLGVLQSHVHSIWARKLGTQLRESESGSRYTPSTTFETFPFPWPPAHEPQDDPRVQAIAQAARELVEKRDRWLAEGAKEIDPAYLTGLNVAKKSRKGEARTLTNLYNQRPTWLDLAHKKLDRAVLDAYGWPHDLSDEDILSRLLALNLERAQKQETSTD
jgi:type II restriction/modification system DNA methylase subunit YeeA